MVYIDTDKPADSYERRPMRPGIDLWDIVKCEQAHSQKSGAQMLKLELVRTSQANDKSQDRIYEIVMLEGPGWAIGKEKLVAMLGGAFKGDFDPLELVGRRVWLNTVVETYKGVDKKTGEVVDREKLKVFVADPKSAADFAWCGIQNEKNVPAGCSLPGTDTPF